VLLRLLALARALIQIAEADVTVGDEWAEAELSGQGQGARVVAVGYVILGALTRCGTCAGRAPQS
jgi:hypothetical protein